VFLSKLLQPWVDKIIVKSKNLEEKVYLKKKVQVIPNGVNFDRFKPMDQTECRERLGLPLQEKLLLFLGDPSDPRKNITLLNRAVELMDMKGKRILAPYPVDHDLVPDYLNAADVFVLTSRLEGSPNVVKEAMACNCPVVGTDVGDVREVIKDTQGCYVTSFDAADTVEKLKLALDFGKRTTGRQNVEHLGENRIAEKIVKLYEGLK
jgi:teichuronic acid biosynthesis glycosyltransferase TuaC